MDQLTSKERLLRTLKGEPVDRIATFDIMHNIKLVENLANDRVTEKNAEDLLCRAVNKVLDLVRHFAVPRDLKPRTYTDENGFTYQYEWWTGHVIERPKFGSSKEISDTVKKDIDVIRDHIEQKRICKIARQHVKLFSEEYETIEEVKSEFERIVKKLDGAMMVAPEDLNALAVAAERYDEVNWWYFYQDFPQVAAEYLDLLTDYSLCFIDNFACAEVSPFAQISVATGTSNSLLYSPEFFRKEIIPREKKKIDRWKKHGYYILAFLDGYKWPVIDDFIAAGIDEMHPCESYCRMEVKDLRKKYPTLPLSQPIDCAQLLAFGTPEQVTDAVTKAIEDSNKQRIIIGSTSEIHPEVKAENALAMYNAARSYQLQ